MQLVDDVADRVVTLWGRREASQPVGRLTQHHERRRCVRTKIAEGTGGLVHRSSVLDGFVSLLAQLGDRQPGLRLLDEHTREHRLAATETRRAGYPTRHDRGQRVVRIADERRAVRPALFDTGPDTAAAEDTEDPRLVEGSRVDASAQPDAALVTRVAHGAVL